MKYLKYLIPLVFLFFACTEEVIKYLKEPVYIEKIVVKTDTLIIEKEVVKTLYDTLVQYDTIVETDTITIYQIDTVEVIVEVTDTVYVEREATITYNPVFEHAVNHFFEEIEADRGENYKVGMLNIDIRLDTAVIRIGPRSSAIASSNGWQVYIWHLPNCVEGPVYRELMHCLFGEPYNGWWAPPGNDPSYTIMTREIILCLEQMDEEERSVWVDNLF